MKRILTYLRLKGIYPDSLFVKLLTDDMFELLSELPQTATKKEVGKIIEKKLNDIPK